MKTLYLDCGMGAAGDMLTAALLELVPDRDAFVAKLNALGIPGVTYQAETIPSHGIFGTHMHVFFNGQEEQSFSGAVGEYEHGHYDFDGDTCGHEHGHEGACGHEHGHGSCEHDNHHHDSETCACECHGHEHDSHNCDDHHNHEHAHDHHGHGMREISRIVAGLNLESAVEADVLAVFDLVAEAECTVHGAPVEQIHFHELGTMDAIADIVAVCLLMHEIAPDEVVASPVHVGSGMVDCAHGTLPVPAPATELILKGIPTYGGTVKGELCTPTGAALLRHFVTRFGNRPTMVVEKIGYGLGTKDFGPLNAIRALYGEAESTPETTLTGKTDEVIELSCNLDDMTAEDIAFAADMLREAGAREVYTSPINMKKGRLGTLLVVLCTADLRNKMIELFFKHTTTLGIREAFYKRYILDRREIRANCSLVDVRIKESEGYGVERSKAEFDDLARIAREQNLSLAEARARISREQ